MTGGAHAAHVTRREARLGSFLDADAPPPPAPPPAGPQPVPVVELVRRIARRLFGDPGLQDVWVEGEVLQASLWSSGHLYFTLADAEAQVSCMAWDAERTLAVVPKTGDRVLVRGFVGTYQKKGQLQFTVREVRTAGLGAAAQALDALRRRLQAEGLFSEERKRTLPPHPRAIGVVTSLNGAVVHDILTVTARRDPGTRILVAGVRVQGMTAPFEIAEGIRRLGASGLVDVVIVARGGGSADDLAAFNEEVVVRSVVRCPVPVIAAVGHETDVSLTDFAADRRAATPSAAAELATPSRDELARRVDEADQRLRNALASIAGKVSADLDASRVALDGALRLAVERARGRLGAAAAALDAVSPLATLARGYTVVLKDRAPVAHRAALKKGDKVTLRFQDGEAHAEIDDG